MMRSAEPSGLCDTTTIGSPRLCPLPGELAKPPIVSAHSLHGQEKPDIFRAVFHWMRVGVKLAAQEHPASDRQPRGIARGPIRQPGSIVR